MDYTDAPIGMPIESTVVRQLLASTKQMVKVPLMASVRLSDSSRVFSR